MIREGFLEEGTADFIQPELSLCLRVLAKASLSLQITRKGTPGSRVSLGLRSFLFLLK